MVSIWGTKHALSVSIAKNCWSSNYWVRNEEKKKGKKKKEKNTSVIIIIHMHAAAHTHAQTHAHTHLKTCPISRPIKALGAFEASTGVNRMGAHCNNIYKPALWMTIELETQALTARGRALSHTDLCLCSAQTPTPTPQGVF